MKALIVNTSSKTCSVTLFVDNKNTKNINTKFFMEQEKPSECLLSKIHELFKEQKITLEDIDVFSCVIGAGSFTGTRIGLSTIYGFCYGLNKPFIKINLFDLTNKNLILGAHAGGAYVNTGSEQCFLDKSGVDGIKQFGNSGYVCLDLEGEIEYFDNKFKTLDYTKLVTEYVKQKFEENSFDDIFSTEPVYIEKSQAEVMLENNIKTFKVRKAKTSDIDKLVQLENLCFKNNQFSKETLLSEINKSFNTFLVGEIKDEIICFAIFSMPIDEAEIIQICVLDKYRRMGFANKLFDKFVLENKPKKMFLEVNKNNVSAINLYSKLGFNQIAIRKSYYSNGDDCLVYIKNFKEK